MEDLGGTDGVCLSQMLLLSQDYGKHLLGVEDLLQKHALVEADIAIQADRVKGVNANANKFSVNGDGEQKCCSVMKYPQQELIISPRQLPRLIFRKF